MHFSKCDVHVRPLKLPRVYSSEVVAILFNLVGSSATLVHSSHFKLIAPNGIICMMKLILGQTDELLASTSLDSRKIGQTCFLHEAVKQWRIKGFGILCSLYPKRHFDCIMIDTIQAFEAHMTVVSSFTFHVYTYLHFKISLSHVRARFWRSTKSLKTPRVRRAVYMLHVAHKDLTFTWCVNDHVSRRRSRSCAMGFAHYARFLRCFLSTAYRLPALIKNACKGISTCAFYFALTSCTLHGASKTLPIVDALLRQTMTHRVQRPYIKYSCHINAFRSAITTFTRESRITRQKRSYLNSRVRIQINPTLWWACVMLV